MRAVVVVDYDSAWPAAFDRIRSRIWPVVAHIALWVEHVGSTSVPGLASKPIIELDVVVPTDADLSVAIRSLATLGYVHRGNLGIDGREAFDSPADQPAHHLYVCPRGSVALLNHLGLRDYLRSHPDAALAYGELKKRLAHEFPHDIGAYVEAKTEFLLAILRQVGLAPEQLCAIESANKRKGPECGGL